MAVCLSNSGDVAKAVASYNESLRILKSAKDGIDHAEVARVSDHLATFYATHWALNEAERCFLDAVKTRGQTPSGGSRMPPSPPCTTWACST